MKKYKFGDRSKQALFDVHPDLVRLCNAVLELGLFDFGVTCGHRGEEEQNKQYFEGRSKVQWPNSKHNKKPAEAVDFVLYVNGKVDWNNRDSWNMAVGVFRGVAAMLDIKIRCGADWDGDFDTKDQTFFDMPHIELIK
jgi:peptidoglycan L-alanyl-D-glutamate endopeptidase CwlK